MQFQTYAIKIKKGKKEEVIILSVKHMLNFSLQVGKCSETKVAEEYCWAMTKAVGQSCCSLSGSRMLEFGLQLDSTAYTYIVDHIHTQF